MAEPDDWRLMGQERYLRGVTFAWKRYQAPRESWDHDHCAFCGVKFVDPDQDDAFRRLVEEGVAQPSGYATTDDYRRGADYEWVCRTCFEDFATRFDWTVADTD